MTQTGGMTPQEHLAQAAEYLERTEKSVWRHPARGSDELPFVGDDVGLQRHVEVYTRLATVHMQMASTKALLEATQPQPVTFADMKYVHPYGYCAEYGPDEKFCGAALLETGECPDKVFHIKYGEDNKPADVSYDVNDPRWSKYWNYWMTLNEADAHPADEDEPERQEDFHNWLQHGQPTGDDSAWDDVPTAEQIHGPRDPRDLG